MTHFDWTNWSDWTPLATLSLDDVPDAAGAYIVATDKPINRAAGADPLGILDIGETGNLWTRMRDYQRCLKKRGATGHMASWRFSFMRLERHFPLSSLRIRWVTTASKPEAVAMEAKAFCEYVKVFCELPPLNYKFNWSEADALSAYFETIGDSP